MLIESVFFSEVTDVTYFTAVNLEIDRIFLVGPSSKINAMHNDPI